MTATQLALRPRRALRGHLAVPGDKSISHRYAMFGAIARGTTTVTHLASGADVASTLRCMEGLGATVDRLGMDTVRIHGRGPNPLLAPTRELDAGNSGTTLRLLSGIVAGHDFVTRFDGDASLRKRPMRRVIDPLTAMGARFTSADGRLPIEIHGGNLHPIEWASPVASAQVKSAILLAGLYADGVTTVREPMPTRDHTERAFVLFGVDHTSAPGLCRVAGPQHLIAPAEAVRVPGDPSSAAVWAAAAAAIPGSAVRIDGVCLNPLRLGFLRALERMGASVVVDPTGESGGEPVGTIQVSYGEPRAVVITPDEVPTLIDELPVLAAAAALGAGLEVSGAGELRVKESDRITALVLGFRALGLDADERPDGFVIHGGKRPTGGRVDAAHDHRLVMAFAIVSLAASGPTVIDGADSVAISYPAFHEDLEALLTW